MGYILDLRKIVGHRPLIMTGGCVLIINKDNQLLLQKRRDNGYWSYPGGSMEPGETFEETAVREAYEETGLNCRKLELFKILSGEKMHYTYPNGDEVYIAEALFVCRDFDGELKVQEEEVIEQRFFDLDKIPGNLFSVDRDLIYEFIASQKCDKDRK